MSNTVTVLARLRAQPGQEAPMRAQAQSMIAPTLAEPGCLSYRTYVDPEDPGSWIVVEEWADRGAFEAHLASPHLAEALARGAELLAGPPSVRILTAG
ncbi:hypothetical protein Lfu02_12060 [Longispora fulva]|uniref:Quinol monooxygenase YgiN n=1 Tax=Longispora fulva TaxID=619741 RepID=A0A8J7GAS0_9ACTN|nr:putative quinol monooxygenase [Longispora fulva]MBG6134934.1 quinol monooxygenase YgiN [Longispora fulva]GIG56834.1 hypothetical protein Lfu02_12060 [Longispora fulva]